jgi:ribonucleoside-diphosphate reductase beta chain
MKFLRDSITEDPSLARDLHDTLRTILLMNSTSSRYVYYEPLGWTRDQVQQLFIKQLTRKLDLVGLDLPPDLAGMVGNVSGNVVVGG